MSRRFNFGVILIDDASTDDSLRVGLDFLHRHPTLEHVLVSNRERKYKCRNLFNALHYLVVDPNAVVLQVDGDDWLATNVDVIGLVASAYAAGYEATLGSFHLHPREGDTSLHRFVRSGKVARNLRDPWDEQDTCAWAHLKTFRVRHFFGIPWPYFFEAGTTNWITMGEDICINPMILELVGGQSAFIREAVYHYDISGDNHEFSDPLHREYLHTRLYRSRDNHDKRDFWLAGHSNVRFSTKKYNNIS